MKPHIRIILGALSCISLVSAAAQYDQTIISVGERELSVDQAFKISDLPGTIDTVYQPRTLDYLTIPRQVDVNYAPKTIKAAKLKVIEPLSKLYRGYVKAGIGVYTTPLLEARFNSIRNRDWAYGIHARHFSSQGGLKDVADNAYAENHFGGWVKKYINKHTLEGGLSYDLDRVHYYGFNPGDAEIERDLYRQDYKTIKGYAELQSHYRDSSEVQHLAYIRFRNTQDFKDLTETQFTVGGTAAKTIEDYRFSLALEFDRNAYDTGLPRLIAPQDTLPLVLPVLDEGNTIFRIDPSIHARKGDLTADVGLGMAIDAGDKTTWHVYPQAYLSYSLFDDLFTPYAGLTGALQRNSMYSFAQENPFINSYQFLANTSRDLELYGGIRGTILDNLGFNARVSVENYDDFAFFVNDTILGVENSFNVIYDDLRVLRIAGELTYVHSDALTVSARLELADNKAGQLEEAFNLPGVRFDLDARYDFNDQFVFKAQVFSEGVRYGGTPVPQTTDAIPPRGLYSVKLRSFVDASLGVEYRYTKRIAAWVDINNITGGRYSRWHRYPVQPVLIMGGLSYSF